MTVPPLLIAGGALGGVLLLQRAGGIGAFAGKANTSAADKLRASSPLAGVSWVMPSSDSMVDGFHALVDALIAAKGPLASDSSLPGGLTNGQLADIRQAWLDAWSAGCTGSSDGGFNYSLGTPTPSATDVATSFLPIGTTYTGATCDTGICDMDSSLWSALGKAVCELKALQNQQAGALLTTDDDATADDDSVSETFARIEKVATEMDGDDFVAKGLRNSDNTVSGFDRIEQGAKDALSSVFGGLASAIVGSPWFWAAALGAVVLWRSK